MAVLAAGLVTGLARGQAPPQDPNHNMACKGFPQEVSCLAKPSETNAYVGYRVGGGRPCRGDYPHSWEGTWGWDYQGCKLPRQVILGWWHGRCQGGTGAYRTDGPHLLHKGE
jgi:hypothetical protein